MKLPKIPFPERTDYRTAKKRRSLWDYILRPLNIFFYHKMMCTARHTAKSGIENKLNADTLPQHAWETFDGIERCGGEVILEGLANVPATPKTPAVYIGNHMSTLETVSVPALLRPQHSTFVVKESLFEMMIFKHIMKGLRCIPMTRSNPIADLKRLYKEGRVHVQEGTSVIIFPQKTRAVEFKPDEFSSIGVKFAKREKIPVVPMALKTDMWGLGKKFTDFGPVDRSKKVHFALGEPMMVTRDNEKEVHEACIKFIEDKLKEWNEEA